MDAFYASVEIRDNPALKGKPLIIGSMPNERGVVATCSYEARKYGVHSGMNIKDAYRKCPDGIYMHPNFDKYKMVSARLHEIWAAYASASEYIALDEAYLDVKEKAKDWDGARQIARLIKQRTREEVGLSCSVGLAYSKTAAKRRAKKKSRMAIMRSLMRRHSGNSLQAEMSALYIRWALKQRRSLTHTGSIRFLISAITGKE